MITPSFRQGSLSPDDRDEKEIIKAPLEIMYDPSSNDDTKDDERPTANENARTEDIRPADHDADDADLEKEVEFEENNLKKLRQIADYGSAENLVPVDSAGKHTHRPARSVFSRFDPKDAVNLIIMGKYDEAMKLCTPSKSLLHSSMSLK